jgi:hypothetical protein
MKDTFKDDLSFLKRERERFPLFVPRRYCVSTRTLLGIPVRLHDRFWTLNEGFRTLVIILRPKKLRSCQAFRNGLQHWTSRNGQDWWEIRDVERFETISKSRSRFKNERSIEIKVSDLRLQVLFTKVNLFNIIFGIFLKQNMKIKER